VQFLAGDEVMRDCGWDPPAISIADEFQRLNESLVGRNNNIVAMFFCHNADLCNGSGRLAEISTMMILLPASLFICFFARL